MVIEKNVKVTSNNILVGEIHMVAYLISRKDYCSNGNSVATHSRIMQATQVHYRPQVHIILKQASTSSHTSTLTQINGNTQFTDIFLSIENETFNGHTFSNFTCYPSYIFPRIFTFNTVKHVQKAISCSFPLSTSPIMLQNKHWPLIATHTSYQHNKILQSFGMYWTQYIRQAKNGNHQV